MWSQSSALIWPDLPHQTCAVRTVWLSSYFGIASNSEIPLSTHSSLVNRFTTIRTEFHFSHCLAAIACIAIQSIRQSICPVYFPQLLTAISLLPGAVVTPHSHRFLHFFLRAPHIHPPLLYALITLTALNVAILGNLPFKLCWTRLSGENKGTFIYSSKVY